MQHMSFSAFISAFHEIPCLNVVRMEKSKPEFELFSDYDE